MVLLAAGYHVSWGTSIVSRNDDVGAVRNRVRMYSFILAMPRPPAVSKRSFLLGLGGAQLL
jgi:hypothetical protein